MSTPLYATTTVAASNMASTGTNTPPQYTGFSTVNTAASVGLYDEELIITDLLNHFNIRRGSIPGNSSFGTIIWDMIFNPMDGATKQAILDDVNVILNYDPRIIASDAIVDVNSTLGSITITFKIKFRHSDISRQIRLNFDSTNGITVMQ